MKNEKLIKQIKQLSKLLPKNITLIPELKDRELTQDEIQVIKSYFKFYDKNGWIPLIGLMLPYISKKSYLDFAFMNEGFTNGEFHIYLNLK